MLSLTMVIAGYSQQNESAKKDTSLNEFQRQVQRWKEGYNSKDAKRLVQLYAPDARYISGHVAGLELNGRDNVIDYFQRGIDGGGHIDYIEILDTSISAELATVLTRYQANNAGQIAIGRNLLVLRKIGGVWLIIIHMTVV